MNKNNYRISVTTKGVTIWYDDGNIRFWVLDASTFYEDGTIRVGGLLAPVEIVQKYDERPFEFVIKDIE